MSDVFTEMELAAQRDSKGDEITRLRTELSALREAERKIAELRQALAEEMSDEVSRDAERYRWLRHGDNDDVVLRVTEFGDPFLLRTEQLDAAIDAALERQP